MADAVTRSYLRTLDPTTIRPLPVLQQALRQLQQRHDSDGNYSAACEQLKTIRQDLVAGRVEDTAFAQSVYETHARLALAAGDLPELRACISMLRQLQPGEGGEFAAQGVLFALLAHVSGTHKDMLVLELRDVAQRGLLEDMHVARALSLCRAMLSGDYVQFVKCVSTCDKNVLVDALCERMVHHTCSVVLGAFLPCVPVARVRTMLPLRGGTGLPTMLVVDGDVVDIRASRRMIV